MIGLDTGGGGFQGSSAASSGGIGETQIGLSFGSYGTSQSGINWQQIALYAVMGLVIFKAMKK